MPMEAKVRMLHTSARVNISQSIILRSQDCEYSLSPAPVYGRQVSRRIDVEFTTHFLTPALVVLHRNCDFQEAMEGVPRPAGITFRMSDWKLACCVWGIRRPRLQPARFQRCVRKYQCGCTGVGANSRLPFGLQPRNELNKKQVGFKSTHSKRGAPARDDSMTILFKEVWG